MAKPTKAEKQDDANSPSFDRMYEQMWKIRAFEEQANNLYMSAKMPGLTHMYTGQEAVAVGVCEALTDTDYITSTHRGHGHCVAKGADLERMFAELLGRASGYCRGKGGSMHIADTKRGNLGANAIVGGSMGIATGAGLSCKMQKTGDVAVCFFGDGALGQGLLYEVMNMAQLWKLPVIYVCEQNLYGEYTHYTEMMAGELLGRPRAFGIHAVEVDGQDVRQVFKATSELVERARQGQGPSFLQCNTYRYLGHHVGDIDRTFYRPKEEEEYWKTDRDPIKILGDWMVEQKYADAAELEEVQRRVFDNVEAAVNSALQEPFPAAEEVDHHVYA
jgi:pyruvate dehydrogenase E1 component alpha subunit